MYFWCIQGGKSISEVYGGVKVFLRHTGVKKFFEAYRGVKSIHLAEFCLNAGPPAQLCLSN